MERLYPLKDKKQFEIIYDSFKGFRAIKYDVLHDEERKKWANTVHYLQKSNPTLYSAIKILFDNQQNYYIDISEENVMQRKDGTIVFSDLYAKRI
jgi:hypothetical protein